MIAPGPEIALRAVGTALAGLSIAFAGYMLAYGGGKVRVNGMEHLAIFAQPRGQAPSAIAEVPLAQGTKPVDMASTGSLADSGPKSTPAPPRVEIVAARAGRVWLMINGAIRSAVPGDELPGVGRIGAIVPHDGGWARVDDKGATLAAVEKGANGAALFSRKLIFE